MKQVFNHINGRALGLAFTDDSTDQKIFNFIKQNFEDLNINHDFGITEPWNCTLTFDADNRQIEISGDNDLMFLVIQNLTLIEL